jgi:hypothetical protein
MRHGAPWTHGCPALRTVEFVNAINFSEAQMAAFAKHFGRLTAFRSLTIQNDDFAVLLPQLRSLQHLALGGLIVSGPAALTTLARHCGQLRSLSIVSWGGTIPPESVLAVCRNLFSVEELSWTHTQASWVTDDVLRAIAAHCPRLRFVSIGGWGVSPCTLDGVAALVLSCPLLTHVCLNSEDDISAEVRALRHVTALRTELADACPFWRTPENN